MHVLLLVLIILFILPDPRNIHCQEIEQIDIISVYDKPLEFTGWEGPVSTGLNLPEIKIGLFVPDGSAHPLGTPINDAANMAIEEANSAGGFSGVPFSVVTRWSDDPWGAGSKEMIRLVYADQVWAVIGSLDGESSHIAEQVVTKAWLPLISPISSDPTLNHIRIPWMFRLPPDDKAQAKIIYEQGIETNLLHRVGLITSGNHDGRIFADEMITILENNNCSPIFHFQIPVHITQFESLARRVLKFNPDGIILDLPAEDVYDLLSVLQKLVQNVHIFMPWIPGLQESMCMNYNDGNIFTVRPFSREDNPLHPRFEEMYQKKFGRKPIPAAAYTYDAVKLIIQGLKKSGLNRSKLRTELSQFNDFEGVTGEIVWDNAGGNTGKPFLKLIGKN